MNNKEKNIVPQLRFPEFEGDGEWKIDKFSSFIKLYRGSSPRPINQYLTKDENGVNWIKIGDTKNAVGFKIYEVEERIKALGSKKSRKVKKGELILANSMSYGATYELELDGCIYDGWFVLREFERSFDKKFLLQVLNSNYQQNQYERLAAGGIVKNISSEIVYDTLLPLISKEEQKKIANCLSSLDEVITAENDKLDLLQDHKKGLLQQLFPTEGETQPKFRFPEFMKDGDWKQDELGRSLKADSSQIAKSRLNFIDVGFPVFGADGFNGFIDTYSQEKAYIAIVKDGSGVGNLYYCEGKSSVLGTLNYLLSKNEDKYDIKWLYYLLNTINFKPFIKGANIPHIYFKDYSKLLVSYPKNPKEQQKIANCLSSVDELLEAQEKKIEQLQEHKKGLLQQLFPNPNDFPQ